MPISGAKQRAEHDLQKIERAVDAVRGGLTLREAETTYGEARSIIHRHLHNKGSKSLGGQPILCVEFEQSLINCIQTCGEWGYLLGFIDIRLFVKRYLDNRGGG